MSVTFPNESAAYRAARDRLLQQELELRRATEAVAEARRALPPGGAPPQDYVFDAEEGPVRLSELFAHHPSLAIYSFMFPRWPTDDSPGPLTGAAAALPLAEGPCPSCTAQLDQLDGAMQHFSQRMAFVVAARAPIERLTAFKADRGWRHLRMISCARNDYNRDYHAEDAEGGPQPVMNVFRRGPEGVTHFWASELFFAPSEPGQDPRHLGLIEPLWNMFDLTPEGRTGGYEERLDYPCH
ncbi:MAG TPA: DUF899 family protein [Caulobacteraceae bacterium]|jgi:predicted dithiol-disulfide oxidoreductase (DUF899 family)